MPEAVESRLEGRFTYLAGTVASRDGGGAMASSLIVQRRPGGVRRVGRKRRQAGVVPILGGVELKDTSETPETMPLCL